jgi:hypothetical protein
MSGLAISREVSPFFSDSDVILANALDTGPNWCPMVDIGVQDQPADRRGSYYSTVTLLATLQGWSTSLGGEGKLMVRGTIDSIERSRLGSNTQTSTEISRL